MNEDDPADVAHDQFARALWGEHALALPVLGTQESIAGMGREVIDSYWGRRYQPPAVVLAAAGHVEHERVRGTGRAALRCLAGGAGGARATESRR